MAYKIDPEKCINCGACAETCPMSCITKTDSCHVIDPAVCIECGACASVCPVGAPNLDS